MLDPAWLRAFVDSLPNQDVSPPLASHQSVRGRLALVEGRYDDAVQLLSAVDSVLSRSRESTLR